jgi:insulysin
VDREAKAVDSEHGKNMNSDPWRKLQLWKRTANPGHPFARFSTGSFDTLITQPKAAGIDPHQRVIDFHRRFYSAGVMRLVVVSRHSLDELEALVRDKFAAVADTGISPPAFPPDAVTAAQGGALIRMVPERAGHSIELQWPTVSEQQHYRAAPTHYVSHLLGHEGEGSAFALLKARGWATGLVAGEAGTSYSGRSFFMCRIDLTDEGHAHAQEAVAIVFRCDAHAVSSVLHGCCCFLFVAAPPASLLLPHTCNCSPPPAATLTCLGCCRYLDLLRQRGGVSRAVWDEMRQLSEMRFHYRDKQSPYSYASSLAQAMQIYGDSELLLGAYSVPLEYDEPLIKQVVADLTPENARVLWASKTLEVRRGFGQAAVVIHSSEMPSACDHSMHRVQRDGRPFLISCQTPTPSHAGQLHRERAVVRHQVCRRPAAYRLAGGGWVQKGQSASHTTGVSSGLPAVWPKLHAPNVLTSACPPSHLCAEVAARRGAA